MATFYTQNQEFQLICLETYFSEYWPTLQINLLSKFKRTAKMTDVTLDMIHAAVVSLPGS